VKKVAIFDAYMEEMDEAACAKWAGIHVPQPGVGKAAMSVAICTVISQEWTKPLTSEVEKTMTGTIDELQTIYRSAVRAFRQTPPIQFGSPKLTREVIQTIKDILTTSISEIYNGECTIQFT
jgi:hypothetical protein